MFYKPYIDNNLSLISAVLTNEYNKFVESTDDLFDDINLLLYSESYGTEFYNDYMSEGVINDIAESIGSTIKKIFEKISEFFTKIADSIRNIGFSSKTTISKYETFKKKHPDQAADLKVMLDKGLIDGDAIKSLSQLEKTYEEIVRAAEAGKDKGALKAKWEECCRKITSSGTFGTLKTITVVGGVAKAISSIATAPATIEKSFKKTVEVVNNTKDKIMNKVKPETATDAQKKTIINLHNANIDSKSIAEKVKLRQSTCDAIIADYVANKKDNNTATKTTDNQKKVIIQMYKAKCSIDSIMKATGLDKQTCELIIAASERTKTKQDNKPKENNPKSGGTTT